MDIGRATPVGPGCRTVGHGTGAGVPHSGTVNWCRGAAQWTSELVPGCRTDHSGLVVVSHRECECDGELYGAPKWNIELVTSAPS